MPQPQTIGARIGQQAPDFRLPDHRGGTVQLSALRGVAPVLLHFFPFAFTGVCAGEWAALRALDDDLARTGTVLLGISCDSPHALAAFAEREAIGHDLLSDFWPHGAASTAYGLFLEDKGFALRGTFLVDVAGIVRWSLVTGPAQARDVDEIRVGLKLLE